MTRTDSTVMHEAAATSLSDVTSTRERSVTLRVFLVCVAGLLALYVVGQRVLTRANVDTVTFVERHAGGFVAVGMTEDEPGFVCLSELNPDDVDVDARMAESALAGRSTRVKIKTKRGEWSARLWRPQVIVVDQEGKIESATVDWDRRRFGALLDGMNCEYDHGTRPSRCGMPFEDLRAMLADGADFNAPQPLAQFLNRVTQAAN